MRFSLFLLKDNKSRVATLILITIFLFPFISVPAQDLPSLLLPPGTILFGSVRDSSTGSPIPNAIVFLTGSYKDYSTSTDSNGMYFLTSASYLSPQTHKVLALAQGYHSQSKDVVLSSDYLQPPRAVFSLPPIPPPDIEIDYSKTIVEDIVEYYSPVFYQETETKGDHSLNGRADYITRFDFDADWDGTTKWVSAETNPLKAYVYYDIKQTRYYWFIYYAVYHPRDWNTAGIGDIPGIGEHEHDMEAVLLVVFKDGSPYGRLLIAESMAHNLWFNYPIDSLVLPMKEGFDADQAEFGPEICQGLSFEESYGGKHPVAYIQAEGHGIFFDQSDHFLATLGRPYSSLTDWDKIDFHGGTGIIYRYGAKAEEPKDANDRNVSYDLLKIDELWERRNNQSALGVKSSTFNPTYDQDIKDDGKINSQAFNSKHTKEAHPPWTIPNKDPAYGLAYPIGQEFSDPVSAIASRYIGFVPQPYLSPVLTSSLEITPFPPYYVGDRINTQFIIANKSTAPITFSVLTVGGRDPDAQIADFTHRRDITLYPNQSYQYKGTLTLTKAGKYHFFCAYQTADGSWDPSIDLGPGLTDKDRVKNIIVQLKEKPYLGRWKYRKKITIDHAKIDEELTDFPVLVKLTSFNFDFLKARTDGYDIRFTDAAGNTLLKYERERHDALSQKAEYWVKIPLVLRDADTEFYIYYCTTDTPDGEDPTAVWDGNFMGVWHLNTANDTTDVVDSTDNSVNLSKRANAEPSQDDGKIYKAQHWDADNDYITHPTLLNTMPAALTVEMWVKHDVNFPTGTISPLLITKFNDLTYGPYDYFLATYLVVDGRLRIRSYKGSTKKEVFSTTNSWLAANWYHVAFKLGSGGMEIWVDGTSEDTDVSTQIPDNRDIKDFTLGSQYDYSSVFNGLIDEFRLSNTPRSTAWIKGSYNSGNDSLLTYGSEEQNQNGNWTSEEKFKTFHYKDDFAEYSVKYPDWPSTTSSHYIEEIKAIEKQGGKVVMVIRSAEARVAIGVFQLARRLPSGEYTVPLQKFIRETIREARKYRNLHSNIDLEGIKEEIGVSQILEEKISSDEDFIEAIIDKNSEYFNTYTVELDSSKIHVYAETFHLKNGKDFIVVVNAIEDNWLDYRDIAEYVIDSMQVKVIGETGVKRRTPLLPMIQTVRGFYRCLDVGDIDGCQKYLAPKTSIEQFSIMKDINSLYFSILHQVTTKMQTEDQKVLYQSGIIVKPRINKEMLEYLAPSIKEIEIEEKLVKEPFNDKFVNVTVKVILEPGVRQECEAELKHLEDALENKALLLANQPPLPPINVPWDVIFTYFAENQEVRLEKQNGEWKIMDIIGE